MIMNSKRSESNEKNNSLITFSTNFRGVVFLRQYPDDLFYIMSSIDASFSQHRIQFSSVMNNLDKMNKHMSELEAKIPQLKESHNKMRFFLADFSSHFDANERLTNFILNTSTLELIATISQNETLSPTNSKPSSKQKSPYSSLSQLHIHLARDWSHLGLTVRKLIYQETIIGLIRSYCTNIEAKRVLVPGAGTGRLCLELAALGMMYVIFVFSLLFYA